MTLHATPRAVVCPGSRANAGALALAPPRILRSLALQE